MPRHFLASFLWRKSSKQIEKIPLIIQNKKAVNSPTHFPSIHSTMLELLRSFFELFVFVQNGWEVSTDQCSDPVRRF